MLSMGCKVLVRSRRARKKSYCFCKLEISVSEKKIFGNKLFFLEVLDAFTELCDQFFKNKSCKKIAHAGL